MTLKCALPIALSLLATSAFAEIHEVRMYNRNANGAMQYEPSYLAITQGDSVRFIPEQSSHNAATIDAMLPDGAVPFKSKINEDFTVELTISGRYGIKCSPHFSMGMVMIIDVGEVDTTSNNTLPDNLPNRAKDRFRAILETALK